VGESGEIKRSTLGESRERNRVKNYGRVVAIARQMLINDDLDAFKIRNEGPSPTCARQCRRSAY
jgi:hypothetical protein